ncbi:MAG: phage tail protein [Anaerolineaceae bacterium]|nr:phage tail protein [Anaerolineaceae bacterium]
MVAINRTDPYKTFNFLVEIESLVVGGFSEVSGLQAEIDVKKFREGGLNEYIHQKPGPANYPSNLVLKRGLADLVTMWDWYMEVAQGIIIRENGSIVLRDDTGKETWRWNFIQAYPVRWIGPNLRASTAEVAVETLELVHNGLFLA